MKSAPVSIHPYFKVHQGKMAEARALLPQFVEKTTNEAHVLAYEFTVNGDVVFCRESYADADAVLAHLSNVGELLLEMLTLSDLERIEFHGPAEELDKLREPLAHLNAQWFMRERGLER